MDNLVNYFSWDYEDEKLEISHFEEPHHFVFSDLLREAITIILN